MSGPGYPPIQYYGHQGEYQYRQHPPSGPHPHAYPQHYQPQTAVPFPAPDYNGYPSHQGYLQTPQSLASNAQYYPNPSYYPPPHPQASGPSGHWGQLQPQAQPELVGYPSDFPADPSHVSPVTPAALPLPKSITLDPAVLQQEPTAPSTSLKLRIRRPVAPLDPAPDMSRRNSGTVKTEESFSSSGRPVRGARVAAERKFTSYAEADSEEDGEGEEEYEEEAVPQPRRTERNNAGKTAVRFSDDDHEAAPIPTTRNSRGRKRRVDPDEDDEDEGHVVQPARNAFPTRSTRLSNGHAAAVEQSAPVPTPKSRHSSADAESFEPSATEDDGSDDQLGGFGTPSDDDEGSFIEYDDRPPPRRATRRRAQPPRRSTRNSNRRADSDDDFGAPKRQLRQRTSKVNYELPPLDISAELVQETIANAAGASRRRGGMGFANGSGSQFPSAKGTWAGRGALPQAMGDMDTSDSDMEFAIPKLGQGQGSQNVRTGGPSDVPNYGRINPKSNLADADPLGVDMNVTFDNVGGLDNHINQLKEMVALPLLYPELFQKFGLTPPRGVLFHGPPGTGKTLLARALAASCSTGNTKIAFFMRKGADVLSKWVGEAERQLRMLFEEARACQPSIIFFDEIDGLAPVRSSKQDQIHASLVSTLLALMDGMDGRGQVIVIGATNRPDAVDSALRRPGRFDREFYFPLPNRDARRKIIQINTREWSPPLSGTLLDRLSVMTKGYGGADLRALCTEAALNAIQRRYPQIYKSSDRLLLDHGSISVGAKDFMMSIQKITPSSARSTSSAASQLPAHLLPLLSRPLDRLKGAVDRVLPRHKPLTALEEAEFVDDIGDDLEKHMMVQSLDKLRTFRPRLLIHGPSGMGQNYLGPAILHHLEGFHVQSLDIGTLMADSTRTPEATLVQLFVEAKRHQPSILFIPSLLPWTYALTESTRILFQSLLHGIPSSDPVLLLALSDQPFNQIPQEIRAWFGSSGEAKAELVSPSNSERSEYLASLFEAFQRPPSDFPDALPRQKRVLEILPPAPPLPPREPTEAEIQRELEKDQRARDMLYVSFIHLVQEISKKFRKVVAGVRNDAFIVSQMLAAQANASPPEAVIPVSLEAESVPNGHDTDALGTTISAEPSASAPAVLETVPPVAPEPPSHSPVATWQAHDVDIDTIHRKLSRHKYYTPADFLEDIDKIADNAAHLGDPDRQARIGEMAANARLHVSHFDPKWTPEFERLKVRMLQRKAQREKEKQAKLSDVEGGNEVNGTAEVTVDGENGVESTLKRQREDEEGGDRESSKRLREEMDNDPAPEPVVQAPPLEPEQEVLAEIATVPEPRPVSYPPFVLPSDLWSRFRSILVESTSALSIDQLEQVRAGCFDRLWRRRADWDRTAVVQECLEWVQEHLIEIADDAEKDLE
ncbi:hypothetical protein BD324DRAFT_609696 [Kockovaella imperatae]|uniref:Bromo domain-containing protein n=1 Tax=Kockovaella imperatae TaxID=4999 RepID=A0A1Y1UA78_9TREE|nr:hypothetical protein BD324DRAFT_609696 [Kockovaella imperatae]ORX34940.1 hypothetical protein BD324DRAFT_609696 [Kockovaella imperatae]